MSSSQQQPLNNTANADTTGLAGPHAHKTTLGNTNAGTTGMGTTGMANTGTTGQTGYGNTTTAPGAVGGGPETGLSGADNYNTTSGTTGARTGALGTQGMQGGGINQPPLGADTGTAVRGNDHIAKPIDWAAINSGRGGNGGAPYGLTGRAGHGGGVGAPPLEDLGAGNDPTNVMGPSSGFQNGGAGGYASTGVHSAVGGPGVGTGMGTGAGTGVGGGNTHPKAGHHGAEAGALAGGVHGHHDGQGHTVRDAAAGGVAGGAAGHEVRKHEEHKAETGQKPSLMDKVKNIVKPHHGNNTDPANTATTDNTGTIGNVGNTGTGPTY